MFVKVTRSYLEVRNFVRGQAEICSQPDSILKHIEELRRAPGAGTARKGVFQIATATHEVGLPEEIRQ